MIEDCISLKSDLIVVNAVDPEAVISGLKKAHKAGIPVVMNNADTNDEGRKYTETFVGSSGIDEGHATGEAMVNTLSNGAKGVVIIGKPGQTGVVERMQGVREALAKGKRKLIFLDEQPANWMADEAMTVMQAFLTRYPPGELDFVLALDDPMALGAMEAIKPAGRMSEIKIYGFNGNKQACDAIKNGQMEGTALSLSYLSGVNTIRAGYDVLKGRIVSKRINSPTQQLIPANIDRWYSQCW
jgi:ribose transport system substrate-binding protein